jgi:hypothetical protein
MPLLLTSVRSGQVVQVRTSFDHLVPPLNDTDHFRCYHSYGQLGMYMSSKRNSSLLEQTKNIDIGTNLFISRHVVLKFPAIDTWVIRGAL